MHTQNCMQAHTHTQKIQVHMRTKIQRQDIWVTVCNPVLEEKCKTE